MSRSCAVAALGKFCSTFIGSANMLTWPKALVFPRRSQTWPIGYAVKSEKISATLEIL